MGLSSVFNKSDANAKLSTREEALVSYSVYAALKNDDALKRLRENAGELGLSEALLAQVDTAVEAARAADSQSVSLDEALVKAVDSSCCKT